MNREATETILQDPATYRADTSYQADQPPKKRPLTPFPKQLFAPPFKERLLEEEQEYSAKDTRRWALCLDNYDDPTSDGDCTECEDDDIDNGNSSDDDADPGASTDPAKRGELHQTTEDHLGEGRNQSPVDEHNDDEGSEITDEDLVEWRLLSGNLHSYVGSVEVVVSNCYDIHGIQRC